MVLLICRIQKQMKPTKQKENNRNQRQSYHKGGVQGMGEKWKGNLVNDIVIYYGNKLIARICGV